LNREKFLIVLSFATIYIVWGSTYLFSAFALREMDAFRMVSYRFLIASVIGFIIWKLTSPTLKASRKQIKNALIAGTIMLGLGSGAAIWSLNHLDSGFSALIISAEPLIIVLMMWVYKSRRPAMQTIAGIALGILGMSLLIAQDELVSSTNQWIGIMTIFFSMLAWGVGSLFVAESELPSNAFLNISIQLLIGGLVSLIISICLFEDPVIFSELSFRAIFSLGFLILFGSLAAFTAFNYLLKKVSAEKVVTNTYVNPVIAMILGYMFNEETITRQSVIAAAIMLFGVFLINSRKKSA